MLRIGVFWICGFRTQLTAEGIGRHMIRLIDGLLGNDEKNNVIMVTDTVNFHDAINAFFHVGRAYGSRLQIIATDDVGFINNNLSVDIWIVPYVGLWKAIHLQKPYILCLHDLVYSHFPDRPLDNHSQMIDAVAPFVAQKAALVICNSDYIRENDGLRYLRLPPNKVKVIKLASPIEEYRTFGIMKEDVFRRKYGLTNPYIIYPSAIRYYKNHCRLIEAFINFRNTPEGYASELLLVMTDNMLLYPEQHDIQKLASKCLDEKVRQSVVFGGRFPAQEMPSLYAYAIGTIVPTLFEGSCPFPILESFAMGTPVAFSDIPVVWEVIPKTKDTICFDPYSVIEIEKVINLFWQRRNVRCVWQPDVLCRTWHDVAKEYISVIRTVLSNYFWVW